MLAVSSYLAIAAAVAAVTISPASAHRMHHSHAMRGLQMDTDMSGMDMSSMSMDMTSSSTSSSSSTGSVSTEDYTCPVCGMSTKDMGYDNLSHIGFKHGQTVYTCGMAARSFDDYDFKVTDTSYLATNVAEFIVNSTDATTYAECSDSCDECADGIKDPVTGDDVTTSNYQYVCLNNGQKIYFASAASKNEYLSNVNSEPRYLVDSIICESETCSEAENITVLSAAAQAFVPDLSTSSRSGSATASGSSAAVSVNSAAGLTLAVASVLAALTAMA
ncbi:hypothetical protein PR003_g18571 [Phytophthora rubi]|uniref:Uncharacterized protein n=1 Tax=Phytophthora rubi TaxID=129364 RepID=A0A6A3K127_9STRA|nr:hypothetical protein PR002_g18067 [Phytophthora rubi]KAE9004291.1 hypothetical protein PR001_g17757 [Phytophthora rubi]KAE9317047.1 hypothetical protein PR003_g18571 [Phytophthora rubi]